MDTQQIIAQLDTEIARLQEVKSILSGKTLMSTTGKTRSRNKVRFANGPATSPSKTMSAESRARIAAAQRARWAKVKKASKAGLSG